jgi:hypothetical protein
MANYKGVLNSHKCLNLECHRMFNHKEKPNEQKPA